MLACIKGIKLVARTNNEMEEAERRLRVKMALFVISLVSTIGLVGFFLEHRYLCHDMGKVSEESKRVEMNVRFSF